MAGAVYPFTAFNFAVEINRGRDGAPLVNAAFSECDLLAADGSTERARFQLMRCMPVKLKAPALNAKDGQVAIEELQIVYETLHVVTPGS